MIEIKAKVLQVAFQVQPDGAVEQATVKIDSANIGGGIVDLTFRDRATLEALLEGQEYTEVEGEDRPRFSKHVGQGQEISLGFELSGKAQRAERAEAPTATEAAAPPAPPAA